MPSSIFTHPTKTGLTFWGEEYERTHNKYYKQTTVLQVYAITKDVYLKWGTSDVTAANFDEVIIAGTQVTFLVPNGQTAVNLIERESSATVIVIEK